MSKKEEAVAFRGTVRGKTIELETETGRCDGERVVVFLQSEEDMKDDLEAARTLDAVYRMRHMGRSIVRP